MGFDASVYANKIIEYKNIDNTGTCVHGNVNDDFCEYLKPDYFHKRCYGTFSVSRDYLITKLNELLPVETTINEVINNAEMQKKVYLAETIQYILLDSDADKFFVKWDC